MYQRDRKIAEAVLRFRAVLLRRFPPRSNGRPYHPAPANTYRDPTASGLIEMLLSRSWRWRGTPRCRPVACAVISGYVGFGAMLVVTPAVLASGRSGARVSRRRRGDDPRLGHPTLEGALS